MNNDPVLLERTCAPLFFFYSVISSDEGPTVCWNNVKVNAKLVYLNSIIYMRSGVVFWEGLMVIKSYYMLCLRSLKEAA